MKPYLHAVFATTLLLLTACGVRTQPVAPNSNVAGIDHALSASVVLYDTGADLICAGTRVSPTALLTAFHCVVAGTLTPDDAMAIEESDPEYENQRPEFWVGRDLMFATYENVLAAGRRGTIRGEIAAVARVDFRHDIAVLSTKPSKQAVVVLRDDDLLVGESVYSIGHPAGMEFSFARGYVSNQCRWLTGPACWSQIDISIWGGSSGGGLYDASGQLCGVASRRIQAVYAFFTPPAEIGALVYQ